MLAVKLCVFLVVALSHFVASENAVICYYGTWATYRNGQGKFDVADINPQLCTHLIYAFVGLDSEGNVISLDSSLDLPDNNGQDNFGKFNALKNQNQNLKTLLAVGGWNEGSAMFSTMAASPTLRQNFINSALKMITTHGFDGLDLDWEYPNRRDTVHGVADIDNFTTLLKEIREAFDMQGLLLTAAVSAVKAAASQSYDVKGISQYLDIVNIMTYDMYGAWDPVTGHNAPLYQGEGDEGAVAEDLFTVEQSLKYWIGAGCPPEKIAVGVPFYGRTYLLTNANDSGVRAPSSGEGISGPFTATNGYIGYNEFCYKLQTESWTESFDSLAKVPYAVQDKNWVSYDDAKSITAKIEYAKQFNITKIMMWSIETDDFHGVCGDGVNPLLHAINDALGTGSIENGATDSSSSSNFCYKLQTESWTELFDSLAKIPYAVQDKNWVSYDDAKSITAKIKYAKQFNITKIMMWSIETDDFHGTCGDGVNPLLNAINDALGTGSIENGATDSSSSSNVASSNVTSSNVTSSNVTSSNVASSTTTESTTVAPNSVCKAEGYAPKPGDCSRFLYCMKDSTGRFIPTEFKCPANLYWDQTLLGCNYPSMVACK